MAAIRLPLTANRAAPADGSAGVENSSTTRSPESPLFVAGAACALGGAGFARRLSSGFRLRGDISSTEVVPSQTSASNQLDAIGPTTAGTEATCASCGTDVRAM